VKFVNNLLKITFIFGYISGTLKKNIKETLNLLTFISRAIHFAKRYESFIKIP
jgi:hypothetical protein